MCTPQGPAFRRVKMSFDEHLSQSPFVEVGHHSLSLYDERPRQLPDFIGVDIAGLTSGVVHVPLGRPVVVFRRVRVRGFMGRDIRAALCRVPLDRIRPPSGRRRRRRGKDHNSTKYRDGCRTPDASSAIVVVQSHSTFVQTSSARLRLPWSITDYGLTKAWQEARAALRLDWEPEFVFHVLRHTCATRLTEPDVPLQTVKEFIGNSTIVTTSRYAHISNPLLTQAARTLEHSSGT